MEEILGFLGLVGKRKTNGRFEPKDYCQSSLEVGENWRQRYGTYKSGDFGGE